jgi:hypothetical protein
MAESAMESQFEEISDDIFAELLDNTPASTAGPADVIGGTKPDDVKKDEKKDDKKDPKEAKDPKDDKPTEKTQEELDAEVEEAAGAAKKEAKKDDPKVEVDQDTTASLLKAKAMGLIERGIWREIKDIDQFEWTDENYGELASAQAEWAAEDMFNEMLDQSGDYGKVIFNHIKNGGDPKEIIDLFKEAKRVNNLDITEETGQQNIIREYYSKVHSWSDAKITRFINAAIDNKALKDEATEVKDLLEKDIKAEVQAREQAQAKAIQERQEVEQRWAGTIVNALKSREDLSEKEKKEIHQTALVYNQKLPDGRTVNQFTMDFMKLQQDPQKYIELIRFVKDPDKYTKRIEKEKDKEAAKKTWEFVKGNGSVTKGGGSHSKQETAPTSDFKINWKEAYK